MAGSELRHETHKLKHGEFHSNVKSLLWRWTNAGAAWPEGSWSHYPWGHPTGHSPEQLALAGCA